MTDERKKPEITAKKTTRPDNKFTEKVYMRVYQDGTIRPLDLKNRRSATHTVKLTIEYPTYEEEVEIKKKCLRFDEKNHVHYTDYDVISEERVRRCLAQWNLHEIFPDGLYPKLHRVYRLLEDDSLESWKTLPPLFRKAIANAVNAALGPV